MMLHWLANKASGAEGATLLLEEFHIVRATFAHSKSKSEQSICTGQGSRNFLFLSRTIYCQPAPASGQVFYQQRPTCLGRRYFHSAQLSYVSDISVSRSDASGQLFPPPQKQGRRSLRRNKKKIPQKRQLQVCYTAARHFVINDCSATRWPSFPTRNWLKPITTRHVPCSENHWKKTNLSLLHKCSMCGMCLIGLKLRRHAKSAVTSSNYSIDKMNLLIEPSGKSILYQSNLKRPSS